MQIEKIYGDFAFRYQQGENLPKDEKGVIFIGNTRAGKSTLCCASANVPMSIIYEKGEVTYINPTDANYAVYVRNSNQSVTEKPNFFKSNPGVNKFALVDMPGNADNLFVRKLINFHYIKTMASNLKQVRFLMVITLQKKKDKYILQERQLEMMQTFRMMLPGCQEYINVILNRVDDAKGKQKEVKRCFREAIGQCQNKALKQYYHTIGDSQIYVIHRPVHKHPQNGQEKHQETYTQINKIMISICNEEKGFTKLKEEDYNVPNIFNKETNQLNQPIINEFQTLCRGVLLNLQRSKSLFHKIVQMVFRGMCDNSSIDDDFLLEISKFLQENESTIKPKTQKDLNKIQSSIYKQEVERTIPIEDNQRPYSYKFSYILDYIQTLFNSQFVRPIPMDLKQYEKISSEMIKAYMSKLILIVKELYPHSDDLHNKIMRFFVFMMRRNEQLVFLFKIINKEKEKEGKKDVSLTAKYEGPFKEIHQLLIDSSLVFDQLKNVGLERPFEMATDFYMNLDLKKIFSEKVPDDYKQLKQELISNFKRIVLYNNIKDEQERKKLQQQIQKKKKFIDLMILLYINPYNKKPFLMEQQKKEVKVFIEELLKWDIKNKSESIEFRIHVVYRLAELLERIKDFKNALALCLLLNLNEETVRIFGIIQGQQHSQPCEFYYQVAALFQKNSQFQYAIKFLEKGKKEAIKNPINILKFQEKLEKLTNNKNYAQEKLAELKKKRQKLQTLYNWDQIYTDIQYLKDAYNIKKINLKTLDYTLKGYR